MFVRCAVLVRRRKVNPSLLSVFCQVDEQLLLQIPFKSSVKIRSIAFEAREMDGRDVFVLILNNVSCYERVGDDHMCSMFGSSGGCVPAEFKNSSGPIEALLFVNQPGFAFDDCEASSPTEKIALKITDLNGKGRDLLGLLADGVVED